MVDDRSSAADKKGDGSFVDEGIGGKLSVGSERWSFGQRVADQQCVKRHRTKVRPTWKTSNERSCCSVVTLLLLATGACSSRTEMSPEERLDDDPTCWYELRGGRVLCGSVSFADVKGVKDGPGTPPIVLLGNEEAGRSSCSLSLLLLTEHVFSCRCNTSLQVNKSAMLSSGSATPKEQANNKICDGARRARTCERTWTGRWSTGTAVRIRVLNAHAASRTPVC